jgi:hypothetical protein
LSDDGAVCPQKVVTHLDLGDDDPSSLGRVVDDEVGVERPDQSAEAPARPLQGSSTSAS